MIKLSQGKICNVKKREKKPFSVSESEMSPVISSCLSVYIQYKFNASMLGNEKRDEHSPLLSMHDL